MYTSGMYTSGTYTSDDSTASLGNVFVNRRQELAALRNAEAKAPTLAVVSGRRRIGKSQLLHHHFGSRAVLYQASQAGVGDHLQELGDAIAVTLQLPFAPALPSWGAALELLGRTAESYSHSQPLAVVLDEFQYLCDAHPALPSEIQRAWDQWSRNSTPIMLVLCGSALTFMSGLLDHGSPLYGRSNMRLSLGPLAFRDATAFAPHLTPTQQVERFALLGGVPQYQVWAGNHGVERLIDVELLDPSGPFWDEPQHLIRAENDIRDSGRYLSIMTAVGSGATKANEIAQRVGADPSQTSRQLAQLESLGYLMQERPVAVFSKDTSRSSWTVVDPFLRWWFLTGSERSLAYGARRALALERGAAKAAQLTGGIFEQIVRSWAADAENLPACESVGRWWSRDGQIEIDVVGKDGNRVAIVGSCKWTSKRFGMTDFGSLIAARDHLGPAASDATLLIAARAGISAELRRHLGVNSETGQVVVVTADELVA